MKRLVKLENIRKIYSKRVVLNNISLSVYKNQTIAILGGNGTGKSTLLRLIAGIERPNSGNIVYPTKSIQIGYVPERFPIMIRFTPSEYLYYIGRIGGVSKVILEKRIPYLLKRFQLKDNQRIQKLSKGNLQKVGIIQAILQTPDLLILDEPISGLDQHAQQELSIVLKELKEQGATILLTYHESNFFNDLVEETYYLEGGQLSTTIPTTEIEPMKLIIAKQLNQSAVKEWGEVIHAITEDNKLLLYVFEKNSDTVLSKILHLQGTIDSVLTVDTIKGKV
ncbi:ABC transporter ATP-binding protein [Oceanobacillus bengalensis]|uniref:ABC transporter ATP-binding protein n=1 Tax=Oceanobacillus bengalensis TaxID=1435466 RepID=UPI0015FF8B36|nr:ABC transporter ATP-binding protein [Oceanobacillus bengalensis]